MRRHVMQALLVAALTLAAPAWAQVFTPDEARAHAARSQRAYDEVALGDSKARVLEIVGEPGTVLPATDKEEERWIYIGGHWMDVALTFKDGKVTDKVQRFINIKEPEATGPPRF